MSMLITAFPLWLDPEANIEIERAYNAGRIAQALGDTEALNLMFKPGGKDGY